MHMVQDGAADILTALDNSNLARVPRRGPWRSWAKDTVSRRERLQMPSKEPGWTSFPLPTDVQAAVEGVVDSGPTE